MIQLWSTLLQQSKDLVTNFVVLWYGLIVLSIQLLTVYKKIKNNKGTIMPVHGKR